MKNNKLISTQLKLVLDSLSEHGTNHLTEMESDLIQTTLLLEEAIAKLVASFMAINGAVSVHREMLDGMLKDLPMDNEQRSGVLAVSDEIGRHINDAVTSLQFEDMTRQLIERVMKRVTGMKAALSSLGSTSSGINENLDQEELLALLRSLNKQVELRNNELSEVLWKTVRQKHMDSGEVELFQ